MHPYYVLQVLSRHLFVNMREPLDKAASNIPSYSVYQFNSRTFVYSITHFIYQYFMYFETLEPTYKHSEQQFCNEAGSTE